MSKRFTDFSIQEIIEHDDRDDLKVRFKDPGEDRELDVAFTYKTKNDRSNFVYDYDVPESERFGFEQRICWLSIWFGAPFGLLDIAKVTLLLVIVTKLGSLALMLGHTP